MSASVVFYANPMSRGRILRWTPEEIGADCPAIDPMGKAPTIRRDGRVVTATAAVHACPAEAFPEGRAGVDG